MTPNFHEKTPVANRKLTDSGLVLCDTCNTVIFESTRHVCTTEIDGINAGTVDKRSPALPVGTVIAEKYEILAFLGDGGMSTVYRVMHTLMKREQALKMLHPFYLEGGTQAIQRFQREGQALAKLDHPNIVKIHDFGTDRDGRPFLIMDLVPGKSLAETIKAHGPLPIPLMVDIFNQTCEAVQHAHDNGIIHRDLKPSNIMLIDEQVKILDFGIAKIEDTESSETLHLTKTGEVCGSPLYMSPEQCRGERLDIRSDIYAMGCLIFEAITGAPPFQASSVFETMYKHLHSTPKSISEKRPDIKEAAALDAVILKCLAKKAEDRFSSMRELKIALNAAAGAHTRTFIDRIKDEIELMRLRRGASSGLSPAVVTAITSATTVATIACITITAFSVVQGSRPGGSPATQEKLWEDQNFKGQQAFDSGDYKTAELAFGKMLDVAKGLQRPDLILTSLTENLDLARAQALLSTDPGARKDQINSLKNDINQINQKQEDAARQLIAKLEAAKADKRKNVDELCTNAIDSANTLGQTGYSDAALKLLHTVEGMAVGDKVQARCYFFTGLTYMYQNDIPHARDYFQRALDIQEKVLKPYDPDIARTLMHYARTGLHKPEYTQDSLQKLERALDININAFYPPALRVAMVKFFMAQFNFEVKDSAHLDNAMDQVNGAIEMLGNPNLHKTGSSDDRDSESEMGIAALNLRAQIGQAQLDIAIRNHASQDKILTLKKQIRTDIEDALKKAEHFNNEHFVSDMLPWLLYEEGSYLESDALLGSPQTDAFTKAYAQARFRLARELAIMFRRPEVDQTKIAAMYGALGEQSRILSDYKLAESMFKKAVEVSTQASGAKDPRTAGYAQKLANCIRDGSTHHDVDTGNSGK